MNIIDLLFLNFWLTGFSLVVLPTALWVLVDASTLKVKKGILAGGFFDMGVAGWFFSCLFLWIVAFPAYLAKRGEYKRHMLQPGSALSESGYRKCPDCAELIREDARKCRFCGLILTEQGPAITQEAAEELPVAEEPAPVEEAHTRARIGILLALLIVLFILGSMALNRP